MSSSSNLFQINLMIRKIVYNKLFNPNIKGNWQASFEKFTTIIILLNIFALWAESIPIIYESRMTLFHSFDVFSLMVFSIEYVLRIYVAPEDPQFASSKNPRFAYFRSPFAIIDLLAILPFYLSAFVEMDLRILRGLRLLRLFKLFRVVVPAYKEFKEANKQNTFRQKLYALVNPTETSGRLHEIFDFFIIVWVIVSVVAVILESVSSVIYYVGVEFAIIDAVAVAVFSTEYLIRIYTCVENPKYQHWLHGRVGAAKETSNLIDLLAILPFFLESLLHHLFDLRFLRVFRLMRLLKLMRYSDATKSLFIVCKREWPVMKASAFIMLLLVMLAACLGYVFEHEAQPDKFENIPQSIYWAVITLASVGYGDISPITPMGRIMTIVLALLGIGIFAIPAAILSSGLSDQLRIERETMMSELYTMLEDGVISSEEREVISAEAKRLHLSEAEVERLLEKARVQMGLKQAEDEKSALLFDAISKGGNSSSGTELNLSLCAEKPEFAAEQVKIVIGYLQQIKQVADQEKMRAYLEDTNHSTPLQRAIAGELFKTKG
jgi:hypothetical protein